MATTQDIVRITPLAKGLNANRMSWLTNFEKTAMGEATQIANIAMTATQSNAILTVMRDAVGCIINLGREEVNARSFR